MPTANLGYGPQTEATIDQANIAMRAMPWYQDYMRSIGQDPGHPTLTGDQSRQVLRMAQANGYVVDEGNMEVDDHGNFNPIGHKLRNTLIVIGLAAATVVTLGAAGAFAGAAGAGGAASAGASAGATGAGLGAVEGGAFGLSDAALAGLGTGAMGATGVGAGAGLSAAEWAAMAGELPEGVSAGAGAGAFDAVGNFIGDSTFSSVLPEAGASGLGKSLSTLSKVGDLLGKAGTGIGAAATAAGNNALDQEKLALQANQQNTYGQSAFETELMNRAKEEDTQRTKAGKDVYRASYVANPRVSPFDPAGAPKFSDQYRQSVNDLSGQGAGVLSKAGQYATGNLPALAPYVPINPKNVQGDTNTQPGPLTSVGNWLAPGLTIAQKIAQYYAKK